MSEQRRGLGDACVLAVPAEYAGASSGSGDHSQQHYLHRLKLTTFEVEIILLRVVTTTRTFSIFYLGPGSPA